MWLTDKINSLRERRSIAAIRGHMAALGYGVDDCSDEEIKEAIFKYGTTLASTGFTAKEVLDGFLAFARTYK